MNDIIISKGNVEIITDYADGGESNVSCHTNSILNKGKEAIAATLANEVNSPFDFYINSMLVGVNGTSGGVPKFVDSSRTGLFGTTLLTKSVISSISDANPSQVIFTAVITFSEAIGSDLSELALVLANGDLYSMVTFGDISKTALMQLTINWRVDFV